MLRRLVIVLAALAPLAAGAPAHAQVPAVSPPPYGTCEFTGGHPTEPDNWFKAENWSCGYVPDKTDTVVIDRYVKAEGYFTAVPGDPCFGFLRGCPAQAKDMFVLGNGEFSTNYADVAGTLYLQGGDLVDEGSSSYGFKLKGFDWESGTVGATASVTATNVDWKAGYLNGHLTADSVVIRGDGQTRISGNQHGHLQVKNLTFSEPTDPGLHPYPLELNGDSTMLFSDVAEFERNATVEGWGGDPGWQTGSIRVLRPDVDARLWDVHLHVDAMGIKPSARVLMSGGSLTPTTNAAIVEPPAVGKRAFLGCNLPVGGCTTPSAPDQGSAGRLETGVAPEGSTNLSATRVYMPEHWVMKDVVWAHWSGVVSAAPTLGAKLGGVEPFNPQPTSATNAWFEWYGGKFDKVSFKGGGTSRPDYGVDIDILGGSSDALGITKMVIGSDATLSMIDPLYVDCGGYLTVATTGSMNQYPGSYVGGCNADSMITNNGTWSVVSGPDPAHLAETRFASTGNIDVREGNLEVSDLTAATIRGAMTFSWNNQGQLLVADGSPIALGLSRKPLLTYVDWVSPGPAADDYIQGIWDSSNSPHVTGYVKAGSPAIQPGLIWSPRVDSNGLVVEALSANTVRTVVDSCSTRPCTRAVKKNTPYTVGWKIMPNQTTAGVQLSITVPAQMRLLTVTGMSCGPIPATASARPTTLTCAVGTIPSTPMTKVSMKLIRATAGSGTFTGSVSGQGLAGDLALEPLTITVA